MPRVTKVYASESAEIEKTALDVQEENETD